VLRTTAGGGTAKRPSPCLIREHGWVELLRAEIVMSPTSAGGRKQPAELRGAYRPHLRVDDGAPLGVQISSDLADEVAPGQTAVVSLLRLYDIDYSSLQVGTRFAILEGERVVGMGFVIK
jgi:translation elongation factor EF-Tu-like GTPase